MMCGVVWCGGWLDSMVEQSAGAGRARRSGEGRGGTALSHTGAASREFSTVLRQSNGRAALRPTTIFIFFVYFLFYSFKL